MVVAGKESKERLIEVIQMLKNTNNPQVEYFVQVMKKWGKDNGFKFWSYYLINVLVVNNEIYIITHLKKWSNIFVTCFYLNARSNSSTCLSCFLVGDCAWFFEIGETYLYLLFGETMSANLLTYIINVELTGKNGEFMGDAPSPNLGLS